MDEQYTNFAQKEAQLFNLFCNKYEAENPKPSRPPVASFKDVGFEFYLILLVTLAAIIVSAMRTASIFLRAASLDNEAALPRYIQASAAMFAFEGGLVVFALIHARNIKKVSDAWITLGIGLTLLVSIFAGMAQSLTLVEELAQMFGQIFDYALAFVLGAGGSIVAYIDGHVAGQRIAKVDIDYRQALKNFDIEMKQYIDTRNTTWKHSDEYRIARSDFKAVARSISVQNGQNERGIEQIERRVNGNGKKPTQRVFDYLTETFKQTGQVPGVRDISRELDVAVGTASNARREWMDKLDPFRGGQN